MLDQAAREGPAQAHKDQHPEAATWGMAMHATKRCRIIWGSVEPITNCLVVAIQNLTNVETEEA